MEREEEDSVSELLRDRFRVSTISIAEAEGTTFFNLPSFINWMVLILFLVLTSHLSNAISLHSEEKRHGNIGTRDDLHCRFGLQIYWYLPITLIFAMQLRM